MKRREVLKAAGLSTMALPLVAWPGNGRAAMTYPKRLVIVTSGNGTSMADYWPQAASGASLAATVTGSPILEPLAPFAKKLIVMRGVDSESAHKSPVPPDHDPDYRNLLTGRQPVLLGTSYVMTGLSIDQHIANVVGRNTKLASLHLGGGTRLHCRGFNQPVPAEENPANALAALFSDLTTPAGKLAQQRKERGGVLGLLARRLQNARCKLGAQDQLKVDAHLEAIRDLQSRINVNLPAACQAPALTAGGTLPQNLRSFMDLTVAALSCDATRVATIDLDNGHTMHTWVDHPGAGATYHGGIAHDGSAEGFKRVAAIERWVASQFAYLLQKMDAIPEGDGTLLDHSVVVWMKEQSNGSTHSRRDYPVVIAGGASGAFKSGRLLHAGEKPHSGLLIALANAMDVPTLTFGDPDFSQGPMVGL